MLREDPTAPARQLPAFAGRPWPWSLARGRFGDGLDQAMSGVLARHDRDAEAELARGVRGDGTHACDLGVTEHGRKPVFGKCPDEVVDGGRARERDHVDAFVVEKTEQRL